MKKPTISKNVAMTILKYLILSLFGVVATGIMVTNLYTREMITTATLIAFILVQLLTVYGTIMVGCICGILYCDEEHKTNATS